jgi:hypothetical protein
MKKAASAMKKTKSSVEEGKAGDSHSQRIDERIKELSDWRGETLARIRMLMLLVRHTARTPVVVRTRNPSGEVTSLQL